MGGKVKGYIEPNGYVDLPVALDASGVVPGAYTNASITVDASGIITAAANGAGGGLTYVDLSGNGVQVNHVPPFAVPQKYDFSAFAVRFTQPPKILVVQTRIDFDIAAATDMAQANVIDSDPSGLLFSFDDADFHSSVGGNAGLVWVKTGLYHPFDFDGVATFNVWFQNIVCGTTLNSMFAAIVGFYY